MDTTEDDYIALAIAYLEEASLMYGIDDEKGLRLTAHASASAAIAIAEELRRIADHLARITGDNYLRTYEMNKSP